MDTSDEGAKWPKKENRSTGCERWDRGLGSYTRLRCQSIIGHWSMEGIVVKEVGYNRICTFHSVGLGGQKATSIVAIHGIMKEAKRDNHRSVQTGSIPIFQRGIECEKMKKRADMV